MPIGNFLAQVLGPVGGPRELPRHIGSFDPNDDPQGPALGTRLLALLGGDQPIGQPASSGFIARSTTPNPNILAMLEGGSIAQPASPDQVAAATSGMPQPAVAGRQRRSLIDIIGRASDVIANVGGAPAQYQPYLDERADRALALEDHARGVDLDELRRKALEQQVQMGGIGIENAQTEQGDTERARIGQALGAIMTAEDPAAMWAQVADEAGIDPQRAAAIGQRIAANPSMIEPLARSLGYTDPRQGSQAKELQVYNLLAAQSPELANSYLQSIANPDSMSEYQRSQLEIALAKLAQDQYQFENPQPTAAERTATAKNAGAAAQQQELAASGQNLINEMRDAFTRLRDAGSMNTSGQSAEQRVGAAAMENVPFLERITNPEGFSAREDINRLRTVGIPSLLPLMGGLTLGGRNMDAAKELDTWQKAIASASDYDSAIRALDMIQGRINAIQAPQNTPAPAAPRRSAPAPRSTHPARVPQVGTRENGYEFLGGNPADRNNWRKVQ